MPKWEVKTRAADGDACEAKLFRDGTCVKTSVGRESKRPIATAKENAVKDVLMCLPGKLRRAVPVD